MRRQFRTHDVVYRYLYPNPTPNDPPDFHSHLVKYLITEVRVETHRFYGGLDTVEAKYPGLDYACPTHRKRLSQFQHHRKLFEAFDATGLTPFEIRELCKWEGTLWARQRYEKDEGIRVIDTTGDEIPLWERKPRNAAGHKRNASSRIDRDNKYMRTNQLYPEYSFPSSSSTSWHTYKPFLSHGPLYASSHTSYPWASSSDSCWYMEQRYRPHHCRILRAPPSQNRAVYVPPNSAEADPELEEYTSAPRRSIFINTTNLDGSGTPALNTDDEHTLTPITSIAHVSSHSHSHSHSHSQVQPVTPTTPNQTPPAASPFQGPSIASTVTRHVPSALSLSSPPASSLNTPEPMSFESSHTPQVYEYPSPAESPTADGGKISERAIYIPSNDLMVVCASSEFDGAVMQNLGTEEEVGA